VSVSPILEESFGTLPDGREVSVFILTNKQGLRARVTNYGAHLISMEVPDKLGHLADITLGYDTLAGWQKNPGYLGASVGRFGNRIKDGKFSLHGKDYVLATNNAPGGIPCHLHGGVKGFDQVLWDAKILSDHAVEFSYHSPDGEEGYPGNLDVKLIYTLNDQNELIWQAIATTDADTPINMVHHTYWNLSGDAATTASDHVLTLHCDRFLATDAGLIPTGELVAVAGTPMDFTTPHVIADRVEENYEPLKLGGGYDHCWILADKSAQLRPAARLKDPKTGRVMEVLTNQPAIQFYGGNFLDGSPGKNGIPLTPRNGVCLETERFPDAPNHPNFPSCILTPGETYDHLMVHRFSAE